MQLAIIVAMGKNRVIGVNNQLPWHLPADLKHFKQLTSGHPVLMGRKTYQSIGKPLPNRSNIVISRQTDFAAPSCLLAASLAEAIKLAEPADQCFIIGGASLYSEASPLADVIYLTEVDIEIAGDTYFPALNNNDWQEVERVSHQRDEKNQYDYAFVQLIRKTIVDYPAGELEQELKDL